MQQRIVELLEGVPNEEVTSKYVKTTDTKKVIQNAKI